MQISTVSTYLTCHAITRLSANFQLHIKPIKLNTISGIMSIVTRSLTCWKWGSPDFEVIFFAPVHLGRMIL